MGLNMYGYNYALPSPKAEALTGPQYLEKLLKHRPIISWAEDAGEHVMEYIQGSNRHSVFYPSLLSIQVSLKDRANAGFTMSASWNCPWTGRPIVQESFKGCWHDA